MKSRTLVLSAVLAGIAVVALAAVLLLNDRGAATGLRPNDPSLVALGSEVYLRECAACHGTNLEGQANWRQRRADGRLPAPPHDESGHTWHHPDQQLFALTKYGPAAMAGAGYESDMPAYEGILSDEEIWAVLSFLKSRWPAGVRARHDQINASARP